MIARLEQELAELADELRCGVTEQTIRRLEDMATAIGREGMVLVKPRAIENGSNGALHVTGEMATWNGRRAVVRRGHV